MATYEELRGQVGREIMEVVELDLDFCTRTYGIAPCTAALGVTGDVKCFKTRASCQDPQNYSTSAKTYRFSLQSAEVLAPPSGSLTPEDYIAYPTLQAVSVSPAVVDLTSMGIRGSINVTIQDEPDNDLQTDPYLDTRTYDAYEQGTFWGKLLARNPFYNGRVLRYKVGFKDGDDWKFQTREYFIDKISGPDANGKVTIVAKDVLKLADDNRSQAPIANTGELLADINTTDLAATLTPAGIGDAEYSASGTVRIGDETMTFTRVADALTFTARATDGTTVDDHTATDGIQECLRFTDARVDDITFSLLNTYANIDASQLDTVGWAAEVDEWLQANLYTTLITEPTGVNQLITELIAQGLFYIWYDDIEKTVQMKAIAPTRDAVKTITDDDNILGNTMKVTDKEEARLSQVWIVYDILDPTGDKDKLKNYGKYIINRNPDAEGDDQYGDKRVKQIFSRWMTVNDSGIALAVGARLLAKFLVTPKKIEFDLDASDQSLWIGDEVNILTDSLQNFEGASELRAAEILSVKPKNGSKGSTYTYLAEETQFSGRYAYIAPDDMGEAEFERITESGDTRITNESDTRITELMVPNYSFASPADREAYGFICYDTGLFLDGTLAYKII
tara:strand:- start:3951 stop:5813 length:1863 start_codon:yes stop_codon:yes gene_type:complete